MRQQFYRNLSLLIPSETGCSLGPPQAAHVPGNSNTSCLNRFWQTYTLRAHFDSISLGILPLPRAGTETPREREGQGREGFRMQTVRSTWECGD